MLSIWDPYFKKSLSSNLTRTGRLLDTLNSWDVFGSEYKKKEDGSLVLSVDVPGVKQEDLEVEVSTENVLNVKGQRKTLTSSYLIEKSFSIPEDYDSGKISADLKDGVLTITLPSKVSTPKESKKVTVNTVK